jgi:hypothetical protein
LIPSLKSFRQSPGDQLDYTIDWTEFLAGDTIDSVAWVAPEGSAIEIIQEADDGKRTVVWVKGGTSGERYLITCTITSASTPPRIATRAFKLVIT